MVRLSVLMLVNTLRLGTGFFVRNLSLSTTTMDAVQAAKGILRDEIASKLSHVSLDERNRQSKIVLKKLFDLPEYINSKRVSVYLSTDNEISTDEIVENLIQRGKECFVPRYHGSVMEMVKLTSLDDFANLPLTKWNIRQPSIKDKRENALETGGLDLIVMPGVAFTSKGIRLGHGRGYYDSFLHQCERLQGKIPKTVALALKEQMVNEVPAHDHDVQIDLVLCAD